MDAVFCTDTRGQICDSCNYLVDDYTVVPWGEDSAKVCSDCYLQVIGGE
jgi:hypothetical protein